MTEIKAKVALQFCGIPKIQRKVIYYTQNLSFIQYLDPYEPPNPKNYNETDLFGLQKI